MGSYVPRSFIAIIGRKHTDAIYRGAGGHALYKRDYEVWIARQNSERMAFAKRLAEQAVSMGELSDAEEKVKAAQPCGAFDFACYGLKGKIFVGGLFKKFFIGAGVALGLYVVFRLVLAKAAT